MNNYQNIPDEMKQYKSWCVWRYVDKGRPKLDKVPCKADGYPLSAIDPSDWMTWAQVMTLAPMYDGIGFVFHIACPFAFIDLDNSIDLDIQKLQTKIFKEFDSYSEYSPSGKGLHIIIKGSIPEGKNYGGVELYSSGRFGTMTGNVFSNKPIVERHDLLNQLYNQLNEKFGRINNNSNFSVSNSEETQTDETLLELAFKHNSEKFIPLSLGEWQGRYPSQSEADQAYMNIISAYTNNRNQVIRIYSKSELAKTDKKRTTQYYLSKTVNTAFDQKIPTVILNGYEKYSGPVAQSVELTPHKSKDAGSNPAGTTNNIINQTITTKSSEMTPDFFKPLGMLGEVAQFVYDDSPRQIAEAAFLAADCFFGGIGGKSFNISGSGLNQYNLLLANTGYGKGAVENCIDRLVHYLIKYAIDKGHIVVANQLKHHIGPTFASGQGLIAQLAISNCFSSTLDEFGLLLGKISDTKASGSDRVYYSNLLQLYNKSGHMQTFKGVKHSKKDNDIPEIKSPAVTLALLSTASSYYDVVKSSDFANGLIPRIFTMEYTGNRPPINLNAHSIIPSDSLLEKICKYVLQCFSISSTNRVVDIKISDAMRLSLDEYVGNKIKEAHANNQKAVADLWSRAEMKAMKKAGLFASCINSWSPEVTNDLMSIAFNLIENDIVRTANHITEGAIVGDNLELKACSIIANFLSRYIQSDFKDLPNQKHAVDKLHFNKTIGWSYLSKSVSLITVAKHMKSTPSVVFTKAMDDLIKGGHIIKVNVAGLDGSYYKINNSITTSI